MFSKLSIPSKAYFELVVNFCKNAFQARSALKALKGLVKLQALIRGQAVRRQTTNTLKGLQSLMKIQSQARASRVRALVDCQNHDCRDSHRETKNSDVKKPDVSRINLITTL